LRIINHEYGGNTGREPEIEIKNIKTEIKKIYINKNKMDSVF
jgi:hypothetical protein